MTEGIEKMLGGLLGGAGGGGASSVVTSLMKVVQSQGGVGALLSKFGGSGSPIASQSMAAEIKAIIYASEGAVPVGEVVIAGPRRTRVPNAAATRPMTRSVTSTTPSASSPKTWLIP